jgi:hypothetical protein
MAVVMLANADPDASLATVLAFAAFSVAFGWLTVRLYRPLFAASPTAVQRDASARTLRV